MPTTLVPQPQRVALGTDSAGRPVYITREWANYLTVSLYQRVGGPTSSTPQEIEHDTGITDAVSGAQAQQALDEIAAMQNPMGAAAQAPRSEPESFVALDYVDFRGNAPAADVPRRLHWHDTDKTLALVQEDGVIQRIGQESHVRTHNSSGADFVRGTLLAFSSILAGDIVGVPFNASTMTGPLAIGVAGEVIPNGSTGLAKAFGNVRNFDTTGTPVGEVWLAGDQLYANPAIPGTLTKNRPSAPNAVVFVAVVLTVHATTGSIWVRPVFVARMDYGSFSDSTDQPILAANTAQAITFDTTKLALGLSRGVPTSRIVSERSGFFNIQFAMQVTSTSAATKNIYIWIRKNGVNVNNTTGAITITGSATTLVPSWTYSIQLTAGQYFEVMWASDSTAVTLDASPAPAFATSIPSILLEVIQVQL